MIVHFFSCHRKVLSASTDASINVADSGEPPCSLTALCGAGRSHTCLPVSLPADHPLGSDNYTTFHKAEEAEQPVQEAEQAGTEPDSRGGGMGGPLSHSVPTLLEEPSPQGMRDSTHHLLESSLDVGTRSDSSQGPRYLGACALQ